ncbi:APC family permease [Candidatus Izemoplasma sp. B36]|uniref:APC family permease n=1 Tax=Candidatus Izemoplasma sp. B36 TaxID=3242468 RepID=UPI00355680FF
MKSVAKKYGFFTAVSMVVGIVIGSGVFKSAGDVLSLAGGDLVTSIVAWLIGGFIMVISAYTFSLVAVRVEKNSGIVDYVETSLGERAGYLIAWFMNFVYYPTLIGILAWLGGSISATLIGAESAYVTWLIAIVYLIGTYGVSFLSPVIAGKWQVSTTVIKLVPLFLIAIVGLIYGLINGVTIENFTQNATNVASGSLAQAVAVTVFAYEGWIIATSINAELKDAKKNLPKALVFGTIIIVLSYTLFFIGLSGVLTNNEAVNLGGSLDTTVLAAQRLFGSFFGNAVVVLVLVSVLGTLNGLVMGGFRGMYAISVRDKGPKPELFKKLSKTDSTISSGVISLILTLFWGVIWYGNFQGWWGGFMDTSILPIVFLYGTYIIVYVFIIRKLTDLSFVNRYVFPILSSIGALYLIYGAFTSDPKMFLFFSIIVVVFLAIGVVLDFRNSKKIVK